MNTLKLVGIALFTAAVTAVSVVWYIDYKINQVTEAVMAPIHETADKVNYTIETVESVVDGTVTVVGETSDAVVETVREQTDEKVAQAKSDIAYELDNARTLAGKVGDWVGSIDL